MTYRSILVHVDGSAAGGARVDAAVALATRFNCPLTGVFRRSSRLPRHMFADAIIPMTQDVLDGRIEERTREIEAVSNQAREVFRAHLGREPITMRWLDIDDENGDQLIHCAKRHDLTVLPPELTPAFSDRAISAARIGVASGGPLLILKPGACPVPFGRKILVAWNDSREAMRAIRDAWPLLEMAQEIHVLRASRNAEAELDPLMLRLMSDHGCRAPRLHVDRNDEAPVEDLIRLHAGRTGADLIVLGLYGHSRLREMAMGGVSRSLLTSPPIPLFVSH